MYTVQCVFFVTILSASLSQRSPYAGRRPIGYPEIEAPVDNSQALGNRFGNDTNSNVTTTTQRLPIEALGDRELFNRLGQLPQDKQPFWVINWKALEENRGRPQTYEQRPNIFNVAHEMFPNVPVQNEVNRVNNVQAPFSSPNEMNGNRANEQINPNPIAPNQANRENSAQGTIFNPPMGMLNGVQQGSNAQGPNINLPLQNVVSSANFQRTNTNPLVQNEVNRNDNVQESDSNPFVNDDSTELDFRNPSNPNEVFLQRLPASPWARGF